MSEEQVVGERRRRREAERAAAQTAGAEQERPLTRREIRAREAALQTGELKIDETGELRVVAAAPPVTEPDPHLDGPATGMIGMTRRQLRELREQQAAAAAQTSEAPAHETPAPAPPVPPVRRPIVRPPASAGSVRSLTEDGTGLTPVPSSERTPSDPSSPAAWSSSQPASVDVTGSLPAIVADPGPLPTTRRTMRAVEASAPVQESGAVEESASVPPATLDELIAGEAEEPEPFEGKPSWADLPPATPSAPMAAVATPPAQEPAPPVEGSTEVIDVPQVPAAAESSTAQAPEDDEPVVVLETDTDDGDDDDLDEHDDHRTPRWLTALMWLVLVVIGIVLGLLIWQLVRGESSAAAASAIWQGWTMTPGLRS